MKPVEAIGRLVQEPFAGSTRSRRLLIAHYKAKSTDAELAEFSNEFFAGTEQIAQKNMAALKRRYERVLEEQRAVSLAAVDKVLLAKSVAVQQTIAAGVTGSIILGGLSWSTNVDTKRVLAAIDDHGRTQARTLLAHQLAVYQRVNPAVSIEKLLQKPTTEVLQVLSAVSPVLESIEAANQTLVEGFLGREIKALASKAWNVEPTELLETALHACGGEVEKVGKTLLQFAQQTTQAFDSVDKTQRALIAGLGAIQKQWLGDSEAATSAVLFAQSYLLGNDPIDSLVGAAKAAFWPSMPVEAVEKITRAQQDVQMSVRGYLEASTALLDVAGRLGVKKDIVDGARKLVNAGQAAFDVATAFVTGNPVQAIGAVVGLLGRSRPDPAAARHAQIMSKLSEISDQIGIVQQGIQDIKTLQVETLKGLANVKDFLDKLSRDLDKQHNAVIQRLEQLDEDVNHVKKLIVQTSGLGACATFLDSRDKTFTYKNKNATQYEKYAEHFAASTLMYGEGMGALTRIFNISDQWGINATFELQSVEGPKQTALRSWRKTVYTPLRNLIQRKTKEMAIDEEAWLSMFLLPVRSVHSLRSLTIRNIGNDEFLEGGLSRYMDVPLAPQTILHATRYLIEMLPYAAYIVAGGGSLRTPEDILENGARVNPELLRCALVITEVTIAQQALAAGHLLLPLLHRILFDGSTMHSTDEECKPNGCSSTCADKRTIVEAMEACDILARNFVLHCFASTPDGKQTDSVLYAAAAALDTDDKLKAILGPKFQAPFRLEKHNQKWEMKIGNKSVPIPTPDILRTGLLHYPVEFEPLLQLRARVGAELADVGFLQERDADANLRTAFAAALFHSAA